MTNNIPSKESYLKIFTKSKKYRQYYYQLQNKSDFSYELAEKKFSEINQMTKLSNFEKHEHIKKYVFDFNMFYTEELKYMIDHLQRKSNLYHTVTLESKDDDITEKCPGIISAIKVLSKELTESGWNIEIDIIKNGIRIECEFFPPKERKYYATASSSSPKSTS